MPRLRRLTPTICAFHLGFGLVPLSGRPLLGLPSVLPVACDTGLAPCLGRDRGAWAAPAASQLLGSLPFLSVADASVLPALRGLAPGLVIRMPVLDQFFRAHGCPLCNRGSPFGLALLRGTRLGMDFLWLDLAIFDLPPRGVSREVYGVLKKLSFGRMRPRSPQAGIQHGGQRGL